MSEDAVAIKEFPASYEPNAVTTIVPVGYRKTDAGVIPEGWQTEIFDAIGDVIDGDRGASYPGTSDFSSDGYCLFLNAGNVTRSGLKLAECQFITRHKDEQLRKGKLVRGDIVLTTRGTVGNFAYYSSSIPQEHIRINSGMVILRKATSLVDTEYLYAFLRSDFVTGQIERVTFGSAQPQLTVKTAKNIRIIIPPIHEQRAIATALSDVDGLLEELDRLIAKKRDLKQATMQQLLTGQTRLPGFEGEWKKEALKHLVETPITDGPHMTPEFLDTGVPFLSVNNLVDNKIDLSDVRYISKEDDQIFSRKCKPKKGDVLLGKAASVGKVAIVEGDYDFNIWSPIALIRANDRINSKFLYYQLQSSACINQITLLTNSSSQGNIGMGDIEKLSISFPSFQEQDDIACLLSAIDTELQGLEQRRRKVSAIKQAMMQELLTGRTRLL